MPVAEVPPGIRLLLSLSLAGGGLLIIAISLPLVRGKIPPNMLYGVRIPKSFASEANWYELNRYGGRLLIRTGVVVVIAGLLAFVLPLQPSHRSFWLLVFAPIVLLVPVLIFIVRHGNKLP